MGSYSLLPGNFLTQGSNSVSCNAGRFFLPSEQPGKPNIDIILLNKIVYSCFLSFLPNILFLFQNPIQETHYISHHVSLGRFLAVTVSQTFPVFDDLNCFWKLQSSTLQGTPLLEFI